MVEVRRESRPGGARWVGTTLAALLAFLAVAYALAILIDGAYSDAAEKPSDPFGVVACVALALVPFLVAIYSYRKSRRRALSADALVRTVSLVLLAVSLVLFTAIFFLSAPI